MVEGGREGGREEGVEGGRGGGREGARERWREGGREGGRERLREGGREERERGRRGEIHLLPHWRGTDPLWQRFCCKHTPQIRGHSCSELCSDPTRGNGSIAEQRNETWASLCIQNTNVCITMKLYM